MLRSAPLLSIILALSIETLHAQRPADLVNKTFVADVTRVADGDSVEVLIPPARKVRIRLHGVDTPEVKEPFSDQARTFTRVLMFGRRVTVVGKDIDDLIAVFRGRPACRGLCRLVGGIAVSARSSRLALQRNQRQHQHKDQPQFEH